MAEGYFGLLMTLYHAIDLLLQHGIRPFYNFVKGKLTSLNYVILKDFPVKLYLFNILNSIKFS